MRQINDGEMVDCETEYDMVDCELIICLIIYHYHVIKIGCLHSSHLSTNPPLPQTNQLSNWFTNSGGGSLATSLSTMRLEMVVDEMVDDRW